MLDNSGKPVSKGIQEMVEMQKRHPLELTFPHITNKLSGHESQRKHNGWVNTMYFVTRCLTRQTKNPKNTINELI